MARQRRLDVPGLLYDVISRGIERRSIFLGPSYYSDFRARFEDALQKFPSQVIAWFLMPNRFHLLVRTGAEGLAKLMRRLMSGYALVAGRRTSRRRSRFSSTSPSTT
jgi:putative transposase